MSEAYTIEVPEMSRVKVCWETCVGGFGHERVYIVSSEEQNMENEGFIGFLLDTLDTWDGKAHFKSKPHSFVFDGQLYGQPATDKDLKRWNVTQEDLEIAQNRMRAIEVLLNEVAKQ